MRKRFAPLVVTLLVLPSVVAAQQAPTKLGVTSSEELGKVARQIRAEVTATVELLDPGSRSVTLKGPEGNLATVIAGDEVRNFDQLRVGDRVHVIYTEGVVLQLVKSGGGIRTRIESETASRAAKGQKPAGSAVRTTLVVADVVAMDKGKQTITLRGPERTVELHVRSQEQFENIAVGDQVEATFTEATAISVKPASP